MPLCDLLLFTIYLSLFALSSMPPVLMHGFEAIGTGWDDGKEREDDASQFRVSVSVLHRRLQECSFAARDLTSSAKESLR